MGPQRIGYFGPNGGGIATLPPRPVDPPITQIPGFGQSPPPPQGQGLPVPIPSMTDQVPSQYGLNIEAALAGLRGGPAAGVHAAMPNPTMPSLHNLLAAAAAAHPRPRAQVGRGVREPSQIFYNPQTHNYPQMHPNAGGAGY